MAGIAIPPENEAERSRGPFAEMARRQYGALVSMRWRVTINSVRSVQGAFEFGARGIAFLIYSMMGLSLGVGLGAGAYSMVSRGHLQFMGALFWTVLLVWQVLPIALASFQEQFDLRGLLRFPVSFGSFYLLNLVFGLVDVPAILGGICCLGIWVGITAARPELAGWAALALSIYAVFNVLLSRAVLAWVDRWLAKRRTREIVSALFLVFMLSLQLLNPALRSDAHFQHPNKATARANHQKYLNEMKPWAHTALVVEPWLPPGLAADGIAATAQHEPPIALETLGALGIYILATGAILGVRLRAEFRGERLSEAPAPKKRTGNDSKWLLDGSGPVYAVMEKELRTIPRSMPLLFAMGAPLLTVLVISTVLRNQTPGGHAFELAFPLCVAYALLGFTQMIFNTLGAEGTGIQMLFLCPTPIRTVLLAKNLLHAFLFSLVAFLAGVFAALRLGMPNMALLAATAAWVLFAIPANLAGGDVLSMTMPYRVNLGRLSRQRGSQASALISMMIQVFVMGCGIGVFELCSYFGKQWLAAPCLLAMALAASAVWMRVLRNSDSLANQNRDNLIAVLAKTE